MKIFVNIAAFCDPLLEQTVESLVSHARHPEHLTLGIVDQTTADRSDSLCRAAGPATVRYRLFSPIESLGVCWARSLCQQLITHKDFYLQIDSHTVFCDHWDQALLSRYSDLSDINPRICISGYPPPFAQTDDGPVLGSRPVMTERLVPELAEFDTNYPLLVFRAACAHTNNPVLGFHVAGGFLFSTIDFAREIPYDPRIYFLGEEQNLALRAWTRGWDIYHVVDLPAFHLYKTAGVTRDDVHWSQRWDSHRTVKWSVLQQHSRNVMLHLVTDPPNGQTFGLGCARSLNDYADFSSIDYVSRRILLKNQ
jgi:hypothetical protein